MKPPKKTIQSGNIGGNVRPTSKPVITADQSFTVDALLLHLHNICSVKTADPTAVDKTNKALMPKENTANAAKGNKAQTTFFIITSVLHPLERCGEVLMLRTFLIMMLFVEPLGVFSQLI